jgi:outer membrane lipoprotein-sorting protein
VNGAEYNGNHFTKLQLAWAVLRSKQASAITLWIKKPTGVPIQEKLEEPYGDYTLSQFSAEKLNQKIPDSKFDQKLPPGVEKQVIRQKVKAKQNEKSRLDLRS